MKQVKRPEVAPATEDVAEAIEALGYTTAVGGRIEGGKLYVNALADMELVTFVHDIGAEPAS